MDNAADSFEKIAMSHLDAVYRAAYSMCSDCQTAEDLTQTTFLRAFERFDSFAKGTNCKAWLLSILRNKWIDLIRHKNAVGHIQQIDENTAAKNQADTEIKYSNCHDMLENFSDEQVINALKSLPDEQRFTLFLIDVEQLSYDDAAEIMDTPVGTIKSRTSRARAMLKHKLFSHAKEMGFAGGEK